ncbi:hypothetical protein J2847_005782 [Azospirillum agricola]|nr:hypothetical protein [Azospirillum agricola]
MSVGRRRELIEPEQPRLSLTRRCELVSVSRSSHYGLAKGEPVENLELMRRIDGQFLETPWYGSRQASPTNMGCPLCRAGYILSPQF